MRTLATTALTFALLAGTASVHAQEAGSEEAAQYRDAFMNAMKAEAMRSGASSQGYAAPSSSAPTSPAAGYGGEAMRQMQPSAPEPKNLAEQVRFTPPSTPSPAQGGSAPAGSHLSAGTGSYSGGASVSMSGNVGVGRISEPSGLIGLGSLSLRKTIEPKPESSEVARDEAQPGTETVKIANAMPVRGKAQRSPRVPFEFVEGSVGKPASPAKAQRIPAPPFEELN